MRMPAHAHVDPGASGRRQSRISEGAPAGRGLDPHSKRTLLDRAEWYTRLTKLAELRQGGE
jgi:hypothetical protein